MWRGLLGQKGPTREGPLARWAPCYYSFVSLWPYQGQGAKAETSVMSERPGSKALNPRPRGLRPGSSKQFEAEEFSDALARLLAVQPGQTPWDRVLSASVGEACADFSPPLAASVERRRLGTAANTGGTFCLSLLITGRFLADIQSKLCGGS